MKLFVTGATGVLGRPVLRLLADKGHAVTALSRSDGNRTVITALGAAPVQADLYDPASLARAMAGSDAVLHLATRIPASNEMARKGIWNENDRIRRDGTRAIVAAAQDTGSIKTILYPSVSFFYADGGDAWIDADTATIDAASFLQSTLDAEAAVADYAASAPDRRGISLRFGAFYGPQSGDSRQILKMARKGYAMRIAPPRAYKSMIWTDDAATAVVAALDKATSGVFDVVEDEPFTQDEMVRALTQAVSRRSLFVLPRFLLRFALPAELRGTLSRSQRISNRKFREQTGWAPSVPDQDAGWRLLNDAVKAR